LVANPITSARNAKPVGIAKAHNPMLISRPAPKPQPTAKPTIECQSISYGLAGLRNMNSRFLPFVYQENFELNLSFVRTRLDFGLYEAAIWLRNYEYCEE
jgi:hypothetical protein